MKTYTLFGFTGSVMIEFCTLDARTLEEAARLIDCDVESKGNDRAGIYRPQLIGARECATLTPGRLTKDELSRIAIATKNHPLHRLTSDKAFRPTRLQLGDVPRGATTFHGNDRLANNRDRASDPRPKTHIGGSPVSGAQSPRPKRAGKRAGGHKNRGGANQRRYDSFR